MKNHYPSLILIAVLFLGIVGTASAAGEPAFNASPVITNVWFAKMITTNNSYEYELLPTGYIGLNDYGRMTFLTGAVNISDGDYAIVQETRNGTALLKALRIINSGTSTPEVTLLTLELNQEDLAEPLDIPDGTGTSTMTVPQPATRASTTASAVVPPAPAATTAKAPVGMATILAGLCMAGFVGVLRQRL